MLYAAAKLLWVDSLLSHAFRSREEDLPQTVSMIAMSLFGFDYEKLRQTQTCRQMSIK